VPPKRDYNWKQEHRRLWETMVPPRDQATTLQGELVRIAGKLTDQAYRNGNCNWDDAHVRMWQFVGKQLDDPSVFSEEERREIQAAVEEIICDEQCPDLSGDGSCYYLVGERVIDWCMAHPDPILREIDPTLHY